jgi:hypothetical protein
VKLEARVLLEGRNLGLVSDGGYYNGKCEIDLEPRGGFYNRGFDLPNEFVGSGEKLTIEMRAFAIDKHKGA